MNVSSRKTLTFAAPLVVAILSMTRGASATEPVQDIGVIPPSQPQPQPQYAQPQYAQPQYAQPYTYAPQQDPQYAQGQYPVYPRPRPHAYREGDPVPPGFHVEDKPRSGLVTAGLVLVLVPYAIGAFASIAANFGNESSWLLAPVVGPWITMGQRHYNGCDSSSKSDASNALGCTADVFVTMGLIVSGIMQATGGTLLLLGYLNPKPTLVRDDAVLRIRPMNVGSGYGLGLQSAF